MGAPSPPQARSSAPPGVVIRRGYATVEVWDMDHVATTDATVRKEWYAGWSSSGCPYAATSAGPGANCPGTGVGQRRTSYTGGTSGSRPAHERGVQRARRRGHAGGVEHISVSRLRVAVPQHQRDH